MDISKKHLDIIQAKTCPYCESSTLVVDEVFIYGRVYNERLMIACKNYPKCDSYVGTHKDGEPLGRLANKDLRHWKMQAHNSFDKLWKQKIMNRDTAYEELAYFLNIPIAFCHIGFFKKETCLKVIDWSRFKLNKLV